MENKNEFRYTLYIDTKECFREYSTNDMLSMIREYNDFIENVDTDNNSCTDMAIIDNRTAEVIATYHCDVNSDGDMREEYYKSQSYFNAYARACRGEAD
jgi:hypothetical protein